MKTKNNIDYFLDYLLLFASVGAISISVFGIIYNALLGLFSVVVLLISALFASLWAYYLSFNIIEREYYENKK